MRITEAQLRRVVKRLIRESASAEPELFVSIHTYVNDCRLKINMDTARLLQVARSFLTRARFPTVYVLFEIDAPSEDPFYARDTGGVYYTTARGEKKYIEEDDRVNLLVYGSIKDAAEATQEFWKFLFAKAPGMGHPGNLSTSRYLNMVETGWTSPDKEFGAAVDAEDFTYVSDRLRSENTFMGPGEGYESK